MQTLFYVLVIMAVAVAYDNNEILRLLEISDITEKFSYKMLDKVLKKEPYGSVVMSGLSAMSPLAQLGQASVGESHDEILSVLGLHNDNFTKEAFSLVNEKIAKIAGVELKLVNRIYLPEGNELNDQFAAVTRDVFRSDVQEIDFIDNVKAAATINEWVENNTNSRIKELIKPDSLDASTQAVLVNAIYFKGNWNSPFDKELTKDRDFYVTRGMIIEVPTMHQEGYFMYGESNELKARLLEIFFEKEESSLLIVLPNEVDGLPEVQEKILEKPEIVRYEVFNMTEVEASVYLPKFKAETTIDLKSVLKEIGVNKLFGADEARLEKFLKHTIHGPEISKAIQKAFIEINEEGAEAGAASSFTMNKIIPQKVVFRANIPFLFQLRVGMIPVFHGVYRPLL